MTSSHEQRPAVAELPDYGELAAGAELEPQDLDLIRWFRALSPAERLRYAQRFAGGVRRLTLAKRT